MYYLKLTPKSYEMMVLDVKDELVYAKLESFKNTLIDF
jgi:hypothetical protein